MTFDTLWINARLATMQEAGEPFGMIENGVLGVREGRIDWVGPLESLDAKPSDIAATVYDVGGKLITPGLIDCHTHAVFGGSRSGEWQQRLLGASYADIAASGGGISATVKATRALSEEELAEQTAQRLMRLQRSGVTTVEIKSGYGLSLESEQRLLKAARRAGEIADIQVRTTCLAAHTVAPEYQGRADAYVDYICTDILPAVAKSGMADAVDAFCEGIAFSPQQTAQVFARAAELGLRVKLHADQLSDTGGATLAARFKALSADHLEYTSEEGVKAMASSGTVAVLLPGAYYFLKEKQLPPVEMLRRYHVPMAVATDLNPGTSPCLSLTQMMNMACTFFGLTPEEALRGTTLNAARALGVEEYYGTLEVGKAADFALWDASGPWELSYWIQGLACHSLVRAGRYVDLGGDCT